jgi:hypothetical protein
VDGGVPLVLLNVQHEGSTRYTLTHTHMFGLERVGRVVELLSCESDLHGNHARQPRRGGIEIAPTLSPLPTLLCIDCSPTQHPLLRPQVGDVLYQPAVYISMYQAYVVKGDEHVMS